METSGAEFINMLMDRLQTLEAESQTQKQLLQDLRVAAKSREPSLLRSTSESEHKAVCFSAIYHVDHGGKDKYFCDPSAASGYLKSFGLTCSITYVPALTLDSAHYHRILLDPRPLHTEPKNNSEPAPEMD